MLDWLPSRLAILLMFMNVSATVRVFLELCHWELASTQSVDKASNQLPLHSGNITTAAPTTGTLIALPANDPISPRTN